MTALHLAPERDDALEREAIAREQAYGTELPITRWRKLFKPEGASERTTLGALTDEMMVRACLPHTGDGWAPALYAEDKRAKERVEGIYALGLDVDDGTLSVNAAARLFPGQPALVHETKRSTPEAPRIRIILPLARPLSAEQYELLWLRAEKQLFERGHKLDPSTKDASRFWFWPSLTKDGRVAQVREVLP